MFAGKTTELLRRVKRYKMAGKKTLAIKYLADDRYSKTHIWTHDRYVNTKTGLIMLINSFTSDLCNFFL